jgi:hypothetical protein
MYIKLMQRAEKGRDKIDRILLDSTASDYAIEIYSLLGITTYEKTKI